MPLITSVKKLLTYKEPKAETFELLENDYETGDAEKQNESRGQSNEGYIVPDLTENMERMKKEFNMPESKDIIMRKFKAAKETDAFILYIDGMIDKNTVNNFILRPLMSTENFKYFKEGSVIDYITDNVLPVNQIIKESKYDKAIDYVLNGTTAVFIDGCEECIIVENQGYEKRNIEKPVTEDVIRGAQEGFTESIHTNISLIRRIIKNKNLVAEIIPIDRTNKTNCAILYVKGIANPTVIREVKKRVTGLNIDFISGSGMMEELISNQTLLPYSHIMTTERPDRTASYIMDGKVALLIDGVPFASSMPTSFFESIQSSEDYSLKWQYATFLRYLRIFALFITLLLPGLYGSIILFHQEMIPTELLNSIIYSRENVPFPTMIEIIFMEVSFELIREGGIRVPGVIGNTLGIVGALILGQAAVQAQLASPILIIIIAVVGISSFAIPSYSMAFELRLLRFVFILFGAVAGFYGISVAFVIIIGLACSIKSFGVPYLTPIAPKARANPDVISSLPAYKQKLRPDYVNSPNKYKAGKVTEEWKKGKGRDKK